VYKIIITSLSFQVIAYNKYTPQYRGTKFIKNRVNPPSIETNSLLFTIRRNPMGKITTIRKRDRKNYTCLLKLFLMQKMT